MHKAPQPFPALDRVEHSFRGDVLLDLRDLWVTGRRDADVVGDGRHDLRELGQLMLGRKLLLGPPRQRLDVALEGGAQSLGLGGGTVGVAGVFVSMLVLVARKDASS